MSKFSPNTKKTGNFIVANWHKTAEQRQRQKTTENGKSYILIVTII